MLCLFVPAFTACNDKEKDIIDESRPWWNYDFRHGDWYKQKVTTTEMTTEDVIEALGGFACGVCHPNENYEQIKAANIEWVRFDIGNLPYDKNYNINPGYLAFKERAKGYASRGIKVLAVTPYPEDFLNAGLDPRNEENFAEIMRIARFYMEDLRGIVACFQITNEMSIERFTYPLTLEEAAQFIGIQLQAMYPYKQDTLIGYNLGGIEGYAVLPGLMEDYKQYVDYVGCDFYLGCFDNITGSNGTKAGVGFTDLAYAFTEKPIIVCEFGYMGYGEPKTDEEKIEILKKYGAKGSTLSELETYAQLNVKEIFENENFPQALRAEIEELSGLKDAETEEEKHDIYLKMGETLFNAEYISHFYCQLQEDYKAKGYPHTPDGQAEFMSDMIDDLLECDYLCGAIVYCYTDSARCYVCGQADCPVETGWGLVDGQGNPKPLYYVIQEKFAEIQGKDVE